MKNIRIVVLGSAIVLFGLVQNVFSQQSHLDDECFAVDLVICIDWSGSISDQGQETLVRSGVQALIDHLAPSVGESRVHVAVLKFSALVDVIVPLTYDLDDLRNGTKSFVGANGSTNLADALQKSYEILFASLPARPSATKICVVLSDGAPNDALKSLQKAQQLKDSGFSVISLFTAGHDVDTLFMQKLGYHDWGEGLDYSFEIASAAYIVQTLRESHKCF